MRIAIFQDTYHPTMNGVVVSTDLFVRGLRELGHEVLLVVPRYPGEPSVDDPNIIWIEAIKTDVIYPKSCLGKFWKANLGPRLRAFKPDVIHSMTEFTVGHVLSSWWCWKLGVPRIHTFHTQWTEYLFYMPVPLFIAKPLMRLVFRTAVKLFGDAIIAPSDGFARVLEGEYGIKSHPVDVVPTGIDLSRFDGADGARFRARHGIADDERVILYLGRIGTEKNMELCIETFAELRRRGEPRLRMVVAGGGPEGYVRQLKEMAEKAGLHDVIWTGFIRGQDWADCYASATVTLFPSLTETQGLVVLESLAAGVPLVSVKAIGPESTMTGERGCLFAEPTAADFSDKVQRLLHDDVLLQRKRREARELSGVHSLQRRAQELEAVYLRTLRTRGLIPAPPARPELPAAEPGENRVPVTPR